MFGVRSLDNKEGEMMSEVNGFFRYVTEERGDMIRFLQNHPRYFIGEAHSSETTYAHSVKLSNLNLSDDIKGNAYRMINTTLFYTLLKADIIKWCDFWSQRWAITFSGYKRSYMVLRHAKPTNGPFVHVLDEGVDHLAKYTKMADYTLRAKVAVVCSFDRFIDNTRDAFVEHCYTYKAVPATVLVPRQTFISIPVNRGDEV